MLQEHKRMKAQVAKIEYQNMLAKVDMYYYSLRNKLGEPPTEEELREYIQQVEPEVIEYLVKVGYFSEVPVEHQAKRESEAKLEQVVAFTALLLMLVDSERSDGVYKILSKLKGIMSSVDGPVYHQSLDDIKDTLSNKNQTIDIELDSDEHVPTMQVSQTFERWWSNQLARNRTIPHYRTEGYFMEFTRATAVEVANRIHGGTEKDILLRGAVGSGKSTGLPFHLSKRGSVLLLEPTKPLAENVYKQLRGDPFYRNPTLRFRGMNAFGSGSITIMTAGFALHYLANNVSSLKDYDFIIFDECHTIDASGMAFRSLLAEHEYSGKIIKVSATPPGREVEFTTQHPVKLIIEESLSFQQFVQNLGSKANSDVTQYGDNILVYVASYNEVDTLSKLLLDKHYKVTKVDGRTMKSGSMEIVTSGTSSKKHFVVATNIIENGVTLDIEVVVDFGLKVVPQLDVDNRMIRYSKKPISYGERIQRLGRVGRHKPGTALRIGTTEKSLTEIPIIAATEAALMCFAYGLPVMTDNVSPSLVNKCTVQQVRTMLQFELTPFFMVNLVRYDGTMHKAIHDLVKGYKLRDSEVILNKLANPFKQAHMWLTVRDYNKVGCNLTAPDETRIPFHCNDVPDKLYEQVWHAVQEYKADSCIGRVVCVNASKVAYTLQTDIHSLPRTIKILDHLIEEEGIKRAHFNAITENTFSRHNATLSGLINSVRSKYAEDHTAKNLEILHAARAQLLEFSNIGDDPFTLSTIEKHPYTSCVYHQSTQAMAQHLQLQGKWNGSLITKDILVMLATLLGGSWLLYTWFRESWNQPVYHQGQNKRQRQKLKFRKARDQKDHYAFHGDDDVIAEHFGTAYTSYGKKKGTMHGTGKKIRKFVNMYGFDPSDFSVVRFVDPLTGLVLDESPYVDIMMVQEEIEKERKRLFDEGELDAQHMRHNKTIQAYYMKNAASGALKIDLTPHDPLVLGMRTNTIAGYPDREAELRQTGEPTLVKPEDVPKAVTQEVSHEAKSMLRGARDYNPIAQSICKLINTSEGKTAITYGIGYGSYIITNQHLFAHNNGELLIKSHKGEFTLKNTTVLKMLPCEGRDILILQMPKDMPPFPQKLNFRVPVANERVCLVGTNFQTKSTTSTVSESCVTTHIANSHFWKHWISTKDGDCGSPLVSTRDGAILGIHSLADCNNSQNYFVAFPEDFKTRYLDTQAHHEWVKHWRYKPDKICWGVLDIKESKADGLFKVSKLLSDLDMNSVYPQSARNTWLYDKLHGNLKAVAHCPSQLVTKHVVKGKCPLFETYLQNDVVAEAFFRPLMGEYGKSLLNKEAYIKDLFKYATPIIIGDVDTQVFENVVELMVGRLRAWGMKTCQYVTDEMTIIQSLNMNSAVGALYTGKKRDYFDALSDSEKCQIVQDSCERLFNGKKGVWNGSLKAELRPQEKILANKTRTFTAAPLDTLLGGKVCVDDFNNQFYAMNLIAPWSVGMTKFYGGWDKLLRQLPDGWLYCDADGSQFDSSLSPYLINAVLQLRLSFMEKWDIGEQMLRNLYTEIVYTPISTPDGTLVKKFKGNNSGQPSTVVDNTLMVILAMHYSLLKLEIPITKQDEMCKYFVNGDDLLIAIDPTYEWVLDSLQGLFAQLGLKYEFNSRTRERTELWFMSHRGLLIDDRYIPKLEPERIVSILEWDRSTQPEHRIEAICAAMVESWGYTQLTHEIRRFYQWVLEQQPFAELCKQGKAPYIAESALRKLYTDVDVTDSEIARYLESLQPGLFEDEPTCVYHQNDNIDAGKDTRKPDKSKVGETPPTPGGTPKSESSSQMVPKNQDKDINLGTSGTFVVPRIKSITAKMRVPKYKGQVALNVEHLLTYTPDESNLSNQIAKQVDFEQWCDRVMEELDINHDQFKIIANGWMAWCIDNGTSPNMSGEWIMMDGNEQITYPMKPFIEHAKPTLRQVMAHYSDVAETYIAMRNTKEVYIPRYARKRNMNDPSLAQYAFDFYVITSKTPNRAREMHAQMKAAALRNVNNKMFGLDGTVGRGDEDTERHTADDVNRNMHTLMGVRQM